jgi:hypothetical protein
MGTAVPDNGGVMAWINAAFPAEKCACAMRGEPGEKVQDTTKVGGCFLLIVSNAVHLHAQCCIALAFQRLPRQQLAAQGYH